MKFLRNVIGLTLFFLCSHAANAQDPKTVDLFLGYSFTRVSTSSTSGLGRFSLHGGDASLSLKVRPWITAVADFGVSAEGHHNSQIVGIQTYGQQVTYLFGPRLSLPGWRRITPFGQTLFGLAHATHGLYDTAGSQRSFAWAAGGGIDYRLNGSFSLRPVQVDFLQSKFSESDNGRQYQNNVRVVTGFVLHF